MDTFELSMQHLLRSLLCTNSFSDLLRFSVLENPLPDCLLSVTLININKRIKAKTAQFEQFTLTKKQSQY